MLSSNINSRLTMFSIRLRRMISACEKEEIEKSALIASSCSMIFLINVQMMVSTK